MCFVFILWSCGNLDVSMFSWCAVSAAACALVSYQGLACNRKERVVMGGFYKRYSVMQQGWTVVKMFFQCMLLFVEEGDCLFGQLCSRCHPSGRPSIGEACLASAATSLLDITHIKNQIIH